MSIKSPPILSKLLSLHEAWAVCTVLTLLKVLYHLGGYLLNSTQHGALHKFVTFVVFFMGSVWIISITFKWLDTQYTRTTPQGVKRVLAVLQVGCGSAFLFLLVDTLIQSSLFGWPRNWPNYLRWSLFWNMSFSVFLAIAYDQIVHSRMAANELHQAELADLAVTRELDAARLQVLQAQIEPHFVFNALANVRRLLRTDGPAATALLDDLLQYLKAALPALRNTQTTLAQELDLVRSFLAIHQVRMGQRLQTSVELDDALANVHVPPMVLLTLVENALKHGLSPLVEGGSISVTAKLHNGRVHVAVADTGKGMGSGSGGGIGLANVRARMKAMYGSDARLALAMNEPRGVVSSIDFALPSPPGVQA